MKINLQPVFYLAESQIKDYVTFQRVTDNWGSQKVVKCGRRVAADGAMMTAAATRGHLQQLGASLD